MISLSAAYGRRHCDVCPRSGDGSEALQPLADEGLHETMTDSFTTDELLAELLNARQAPGDNPTALRVRELIQITDKSAMYITRQSRVLIDAGQAEVVRKPWTRIDGTKTTIPAYRMVVAKANVMKAVEIELRRELQKWVKVFWKNHTALSQVGIEHYPDPNDPETRPTRYNVDAISDLALREGALVRGKEKQTTLSR